MTTGVGAVTAFVEMANRTASDPGEAITLAGTDARAGFEDESRTVPPVVDGRKI